MVSTCKDVNNGLGGTDVSSRSEEIHVDGKRIEGPGALTSRMCYAGLLNKRSAATAVL